MVYDGKWKLVAPVQVWSRGVRSIYPGGLVLMTGLLHHSIRRLLGIGTASLVQSCVLGRQIVERHARASVSLVEHVEQPDPGSRGS